MRTNEMTPALFSVCIDTPIPLAKGIPATRVLLMPWGNVRSRNQPFIVDDQAAQSIQAAFAEHRVQIPIDAEHTTVGGEFARPDRLAPATGWITSVEVKPGDGIYGCVEWTALGLQLLRDKQYKYLSPVVQLDQATGRAVRLHSAGLVNRPAIAAMPALVNQDVAIGQNYLSSAGDDVAQDGNATLGEGARRDIETWNNDAKLREEFRGDREAYLAFCKYERLGVAGVARSKVKAIRLDDDSEASPTNCREESNEAVLAWNRDAGLRDEFGDNMEVFLAYRKAEAAGLVKIVCREPANDTREPKINDPILVWNRDADLRAEFGGDQETYLAFCRANDSGLVKVFNRRAAG